jgi:hypothetical protein
MSASIVMPTVRFRVRVEVDPALVDGLEPECVNVLAGGVLVSTCYRGVRLDGACMLPIVATSMQQAVESLHDIAEMCERLADAPRVWPPPIAAYEPWLRDCAAFYRLVAEQVVLQRDRLWPTSQ